MSKYKTIISQYKEGAESLCQQLRDWEIGSDEAHKLERRARIMWYEDAANQGISRAEAKKIWEKEIVEGILRASEDPAWDDIYLAHVMD